MRKLIFSLRLAISNLKKNSQFILPFLFASVLSVMVFHVILTMASSNAFETMRGGVYILSYMWIGLCIVGLFLFIFLFYTNSFLIKRRKKELALYQVLGLRKRDVSIILILENILLLVIALFAGVVLSVLLGRLLFMAVLKLLSFDVPFTLATSFNSIRITLVYFVILFALLTAYNLNQIYKYHPIELIQEGLSGEKEPKSRKLMFVIGCVCLVLGYGLSLKTSNSMEALVNFFPAVILVIIATYCLYISGSIVILKLLKKNKSFYYQKKHFITVSSLMYRMKQNAVGLANICILSTMVLVMISSTSTLYAGIEDQIALLYPREVNFTSNQDIRSIINASIKELQVEAEDWLQYRYVNFGALQQEKTFITDIERNAYSFNTDELRSIYLISENDYNIVMNQDVYLNDEQVLLAGDAVQTDLNELVLFDQEYTVLDKVDEFPITGHGSANMTENWFIIVNETTFEELTLLAQKAYPNEVEVLWLNGLNVEESVSQEFVNKCYEKLLDVEIDFDCQIRSKGRISFQSLYGGLLYLGIILGAVFMMAAVLIMYYKQIVEGMEDRQRYEILQKVGMSQLEVNQTIQFQVIIVFFLPLFTALIHILFAYPLISRLLQLLSLGFSSKFWIVCLICFAIFAIVYCLIYKQSAKIYYRIVRY